MIILHKTIHDEILEEVGYLSDEIEKILDTYFVPGYSSEHITVFLCEKFLKKYQMVVEYKLKMNILILLNYQEQIYKI